MFPEAEAEIRKFVDDFLELFDADALHHAQFLGQRLNEPPLVACQNPNSVVLTPTKCTPGVR
ncbi:hypothetical protein D3C72_1820300 [compost metagenome]